MALTPGTRLGVYEVTAQIGEGGMGQVYRATDTKLKRQVAIKILPPVLAADSDRLARFQREAEVLASLNHPNIAAIHGLEDSGGMTALVMELVEGDDLSQRIARGALPLDEALPIARQIAEALDAAHEQGIIHRDLKPANIKVRADGTVKVLDFGLAKALEPTGAMSGSVSMPPTITSPAMTQAGMILGTAAYMSPEQARGKSVDKRADIWAFGCVLFEMLTGRRPFDGEDMTEVLGAVVRLEPQWDALPSDVPPLVRTLLQSCLIKDPRRRVADISTTLFVLDKAGSVAPLPIAEPATSWAPRGRLPWMAFGVAVLVAAALAIPTLRHLRETPPPLSSGSVARVELGMPSGVQLYTPTGRGVAVSPDGSRVVFIGIAGAVRQIYVRQIDRFEAVPLRGTETAAECCMFSPDGRSIGFGSGDGALRRVSLTDGLVATITTGSEFMGEAWGSDDSIVFVRSGALWRVASSGGQPTPLTMAIPGGVARRYGWPTILPGAVAILFASSDIGGDNWQIESFVPATGERHTVLGRGSMPLYAPSGHLIFYRDGELLAAPFDVETQRVTGATVRILESIPQTSAGIPLVDVSAAGVLVYAPTTAAARLVWVSRQGAEQAVADAPRIYANPRLDPKGRWVLVQAGDLWLHDLARSTFTRLIGGVVSALAFPVLTPDGARVVFRTTSGLSSQALDGSGRGEVFAGTTLADYPGSISPDGKLLLFVRLSPETSGDIYQASLSGNSEVHPILKTAAYEGSARLSPDGHWLAYTSNDSGRMEVYLRPFPEPDQRWQVSTQGGTQPVWNPNGREIFYRSGDKMMVVSVSTGTAPTLSDPKVLFDQPYAFGSGITIPNYDISADGQRFVMVKEDSNASRLNLVLNWQGELTRLVPANSK